MTRPQITTRLQRTVAVAAALLIHVLLFVPSNVTFGVVSGLFLLIPAALAGWWFGIRGGLLAGFIGVGIHAALAIFGAHAVPPDVLHLIPVFALLPTAGLAAGMFRDAREQADKNKAQLALEEAAFAEERASWRLTETALREIEREYFSMISHTHDGIAVLKGAAIDFSNQAFRDLMGHAGADDVRGLDLRDLLAPASRIELDARMSNVPDGTARIPRFEAEISRADGSCAAVEITITPFVFREQNCYLAVLRNITERRSAELATARSLSLLQATLDSIEEGILALDEQGHIVSSNNRFAEIWALPPSIIAEGAAKDVRDAMEDRCTDTQAFRGSIDAADRDAGSRTQDYVFLKDGRILERHSMPQILHGARTGRVWSFRDITNEFHAAEELRISSESMRKIVESIDDGILVLDARDSILDVSGRALALLSIGTRDVLLGQNLMDYVHTADRARIGAMLESAWASGTTETACTLLHIGELRGLHVEFSATVLGGSTAEEATLLLRLRDLRETRRREAQFRAAALRADAYDRILAGGKNIGLVWRDDAVRTVELVTRNIALLGYTTEEFTGSNGGYIAMVHPDDAPLLKFGQSDAKHPGGTHEVEYRLCGKDGVYRWVRETSWTRPASDGTGDCIEGSIVEVGLPRALAGAPRQAFLRPHTDRTRFNREMPG